MVRLGVSLAVYHDARLRLITVMMIMIIIMMIIIQVTDP